jgi:hypothetical protein
MNMWKRGALGIAAALFLFVGRPVAQAPLPLVQPGELVYEGAIRTPPINSGNSSFGYGGWAMAFNAAHNSMYYVGHDYQQAVAEITLPTPVIGTSLGQLPTASVLQPFAGITHGLPMNSIGTSPSGTYRWGGLFVYGGRLIGASFSTYTQPGNITKSHWTHSAQLSDQTGTGPWRLAPTSLDPGFMGGYMAAVPPEWQALLGGPALTGQCCQSIITRTSYGPSAFAFDPAQLGVASEPIPTTPLLYNDELHKQPDGDWQTSNTSYFNGSTLMAGMFIPAGTRSLLFIGRQGTGTFCYGSGCASVPADPYCPNDIIHAWPYQLQVWAFDLDDLAAVKAGTKQPWELRPYATWPLTGNETATKLPFFTSCMIARGLTHDPATNRMWVASGVVDGDNSVIHQFRVVRGGTPPTCSYTVTPSVSLPAAGGSANVTVTASDSTCAWTAASSGFVTAAPVSGTGSGTVALTAGANTGVQRTQAVQVAGQTVTVTQAAPPPPPPVDCQVSAWSAWSAWVVNPADPTQESHSRTRTVVVPAANGGAACPVLTETETQPTVLVAVACQATEWSLWSPWAVDPTDPTKELRTRSRVIIPPATTEADSRLIDTEAPIVSLTVTRIGTTADYQIALVVTDNRGVTSVELLVDGVVTAYPGTVSLAASGPHIIFVHALDETGNVGESEFLITTR